MEYTTKTIDGYMGAIGYKGSNSHLRIHGTELKNLILNELKKNGIKASARQSRGGYTDSFTFTFKFPKEWLLSDEELKKDISKNEWKYRKYLEDWGYTKEQTFNCLKVEDEFQVNHYYIYDDIRLKEKALKTLAVADGIISSFNYDNSNIMVDYFDVGFYYSLRVKAI